MRQQRELFKLIEVSIYAAMIVIAIYFIRIPMPSAISRTFVHPGNALVILGSLLMGFKRGTLAAMLGLFIFDLTSGYITAAPFTLLENFIVLLVVEFVYRYLLKRRDHMGAIVLIGVVGAVTKIVIIFIKYVATQLALGNTMTAAFSLALTGMPASLFTGVVTAILIPVLYLPMKKIFQQFHPIGE